MKKYYPRFIMVVTLLMMVSSLIIAQTAAKPIGPPITKFKPPVVQSYLGTSTGKNAVASKNIG
jgi:hypothetical protein